MRRRTKVLLLLSALLVLASGWWYSTRYLVLSIPVLPQTGGGAFWWENQFAQLAYADAPGTLYLHRQAGTAYSDRHGWHSVEEAFAFFHQWLSDHGWERRAIYDGGDPALPESRLLTSSQFREYCRPGDDWGYSGRVAVAIWPIGDSVKGFHVVIVTAKPSFFRRLNDELD